MKDILSENSKKEYPVTELSRLEKKWFVLGVCYFINKVPKFNQTKEVNVQNINSIPLGRRRTKETGNRNATAISDNCYQPELNTCYWMEQRKLRKRQRKFSYGTLGIYQIHVLVPRRTCPSCHQFYLLLGREHSEL
jgi:hypothetical protein